MGVLVASFSIIVFELEKHFFCRASKMKASEFWMICHSGNGRDSEANFLTVIFSSVISVILSSVLFELGSVGFKFFIGEVFFFILLVEF